LNTVLFHEYINKVYIQGLSLFIIDIHRLIDIA
jgi:hypothetical protein